MNRLQFLKEMRNSLVETVKEASAPLLEEEVKKMKEIFSSVHYVWHLLGTYDAAELKRVEMRNVHHVPVVVYVQNGKIKARKAICSHCHVIPHYIELEHRLICLYCDREFDLASETGTLKLPLLATKKIKNQWYVRLERDSYA
ncbi:Rieske 2Fe-2S domain-containing protein [Parageobacillus thermoglucosidasius]|uniref:Rieske 2Fe-2S domain-containing protein n=1 Tax=Parageobacillus thermoglucosidasius TaxID=1426 RepID=UPI0001D17087|nr:Rieske 2Fe-2S domain-containing protein [Parageobacillus thermoglucosidasius]AEH48073.1 Rieske (2Fe-2S) iron-sulfur domain protein [Parageobacillus thermoglucosidasius C56-YS93]